jgi:hypothetical protein
MDGCVYEYTSPDYGATALRNRKSRDKFTSRNSDSVLEPNRRPLPLQIAVSLPSIGRALSFLPYAIAHHLRPPIFGTLICRLRLLVFPPSRTQGVGG